MQELKNCLGLRIKTDPAQAVFLFARYAGRVATVLARADIRPATVIEWQCPRDERGIAMIGEGKIHSPTRSIRPASDCHACTCRSSLRYGPCWTRATGTQRHLPGNR